ncbi:uncharacterized protein PHACADRAFT_213866 [Phanerochaete carnosa HHB-10118-sp]|uniref:Nephrocystin 3-like N-terminal domain-containing protein n=1 Tax=Phanerochaete carnosa (strain HHB-10118-sp) TaxID=650164 RepID=K5VU46_PHACS|nr:uncharacterized protein PHACADRAFT_213866 [Phanerochaete carnosa HHB-10118-sp]EKM50104.1 hypothetical protein PHACADRAFT_213866 [Phanerochaete carnosa HHB-10118-sp]
MPAGRGNRAELATQSSNPDIGSRADAAIPASRSRCMELVDIALDTATPFFELAESVLELVPVPGLPSIAKSLAIIVDRVKDARTNDDVLRAFNEEVTALDDVIKKVLTKAQTVIRDYDGDDLEKDNLLDGIMRSEELQVRAQELQNIIGELRKSAANLKGGHGFRGFLKGFFYASRNEAILSGMNSGLERAVAMFKLRGQISIEKMLSNAMSEAKAFRKKAQIAEQEQIISSIPHVPAGYRSVDDLKSEFMEGTRTELFEELALWANGGFPQNNPKPFYLLCGAAGLGKSCIAHQLCMRLGSPEQSRLGASFFFVRGRQDLESIRSVFPTLVHQLAQSVPRLKQNIATAAREYLKQGDQQQMPHAFEELLLRPLVRTNAIAQEPVILVLDGLDECKEREQVPHLLKLVLELVRSVPWIRVFAASRPEPHILAALTSAEARALVFHRNLDETLHKWKGDVRSYIEGTLLKIPQYSTFVRGHPDMLERLIKLADGVFIYARIAVRFLDTYRDDPEEQFQLLLASKGAGLSPLDALYLQVLRSAFPPEDLHTLKSHHERLRSLLSFIALRKQPMTPHAVANLLGLKTLENDVITMVDRLRSIVLINPDGCMLPLHASLGEFLLDDKRCSDPLYHVDRSNGHARLTSACLTVLTSFRTLSACLEARRYRSDDCVLYAKMYWDEHLRDAKFSNGLADQVRTALIQATPAYMGVHTASGTFDGTITAATRVARFLEPHMGTSEANEICIEYAKSTAYSILWWNDVRQYPGVDPIINPCYYSFGALDLDIGSDDMARYNAAHKRFAREIEDARLTKLWYRIQ